MTLQYGEETSENSMASHGVESWIFSVLASRVNRIATPDSARVPMMTGTCGPIRSESLGRWDQDSSSWRTCQVSLFDLTMDGKHMAAPWSESWPKSGMTRNGELYPLPTLERPISATGGGSWHIPTPTSADVYTANMESSQQSDDSMHSVSLPDFVGRFPTPCAGDSLVRNKMRPSRAATNRKTGYLSEMIGNWPTPDAGIRGSRSEGAMSADKQSVISKNGQRMRGTDLSTAAHMFPTPVEDGQRNWPTPTPWRQQESIENWTERRARVREERHNGNGFGIPLDMAVRMFPTPTSRDHKDGDAHSCQNVPVNGLLVREVHMLPTPSGRDYKDTGQASLETWEARRDRKLTEGINLHRPLGIAIQQEARMLPTPSSGGESGGDDLVTAVDGSLSPDWVSWLMGLPVGWTSLEPLPREEYLDWFHAQMDGTWWLEERGLPRVATGIKDRVNRLKCLGNGIVPASLALFLRGTR